MDGLLLFFPVHRPPVKRRFAGELVKPDKTRFPIPPQFVNLVIYIPESMCYNQAIRNRERKHTMSTVARRYAYSYASFAYYMGKAYIGLAQSRGV